MSSGFRWALLLFAVFGLILVPFALFEEPLTAWTEELAKSERSRPLIAAIFAGLLAVDVLLPVPSSLVSVAAGYFLGFGGGALLVWTGMTAGVALGYALGAGWGRPATRRWVGREELARVKRLERRFGDAAIIVARAVPVLAEASVVFAGVTRMSFARFLALTGLSNAAIALVYSAVGAFALQANSFLWAFGGAVLLPALGLLAMRALERRSVRRRA